MSRNKKILLGLLTISPFFGMILYFIVVMTMISSFGGMATADGVFDPETDPVAFQRTIFGTFGLAMVVILFTVIISIALMIYYIIHIVNNETLDKEKNEPIIWILVTLMAGTIGQIAYWYMKIWREPINDANTLS